MSFELFPSLGTIDIHGIAHLNIIVPSGRGRLSVLGVGHWDITALSGSRGLGIFVVGHRRVIGGFGNGLLPLP
jgi:hypothetical protein